MLRFVADLGNSRFKWSRLDDAGRLVEPRALALDDPAAWERARDEWRQAAPGPSAWAISSVNPPVAGRLEQTLSERTDRRIAWYRNASEVPIARDVEGAGTGGADRALAVLAALGLRPGGRPALVVSCGTAITIERITAEGVWQGGVIAPGLFLNARALHQFTAQLPLVRPDASAPSWGRGTLRSLEAGVFWGTVGAVRELIARQGADIGTDPWIVWTGGDAPPLAGAVQGDQAVVIADLVLRGLARAEFSAGLKDA